MIGWRDGGGAQGARSGFIGWELGGGALEGARREGQSWRQPALASGK